MPRGSVRTVQETASAFHDSQDLAALCKLTDRLYRAESLDGVFSTALDVICEALGCSRASILLFDKHGVMRFVAWRGLSEDYRRALDINVRRQRIDPVAALLRSRGVPMVFASGYGQSGMAGQGNVTVLEKPFRLEGLAAALGRLV
jgi:GAF domain-containing protein